MAMKLSDYVFKFLVDKGVKHVFMLPGGGAMHLDDSLGRCSGICYTCFLHEQALARRVKGQAGRDGFGEDLHGNSKVVSG